MSLKALLDLSNSDITGYSGTDTIYVCPSCGGPKLYVSQVNGLYHCFKCGIKGKRPVTNQVEPEKPKDLKKLSSIYKNLLNRLPLLNEGKNYLRRRGITGLDLENNFYQVTPTSILSIYGLDVEDLEYAEITSSRPNLLLRPWLRGNRLLIPCYNANKVLYSIKSRSLDDSGTRYLTSPGSFPGSNVYVPRNYRSSNTLIITEGELKAFISCKFGYSSVSINGIGATTNQKVRKQLLSLANDKKRVYIALDADEEWQKKKPVINAFLDLQKLFQDKGACCIFGNGAYKIDLDSEILEKGVNHLDHLFEKFWINRSQTTDKLKECLLEIS